MISDTLFEAVQEIERYQTDPTLGGCYSDPAISEQIARVKEAMRDLQLILDDSRGAA